MKYRKSQNSPFSLALLGSSSSSQFVFFFSAHSFSSQGMVGSQRPSSTGSPVHPVVPRYCGRMHWKLIYTVLSRATKNPYVAIRGSPF